MNYMKIYNDLVEHAKSQVLPKNTYTEKHHIIMKSLGGLNDKTNLVAFTARQHYIAHLLLYKHYKQEMLLGKDKTPYHKSLGALSALIQLPAAYDDQQVAKRAFKFGSKLFEKWKIELSEYNGLRTKQRLENLKTNDPEKYQEFCSNVSKGIKKHNEEFGFWWSGKHHKEETKQKIRDFHAKNHPQAGSKNSQYGTIAIYNMTTFERATQPKDQPIPEGWIKGRFYNATPEELIERKKLLEQILEIDPNSKATIRYKLDRLEKILLKLQDPQENIKVSYRERINKQLKKIENQSKHLKKIELLREQYLYFDEFGWNEFVKKYDYQYSKQNFVQQCQRYVEEYIPQNGKKRGK